MAGKSKVKGSRKGGRSKRKAEGRTHPISFFIRNRIPAETYFTQTNQSFRKG